MVTKKALFQILSNSLIVIIRLMLSVWVWPKVITLSGFYCRWGRCVVAFHLAELNALPTNLFFIICSQIRLGKVFIASLLAELNALSANLFSLQFQFEEQRLQLGLRHREVPQVALQTDPEVHRQPGIIFRLD